MNLDQFPLWGLLKENITVDMLQSIAIADYGYDSEEHFSALKNIYDNSETPATLKLEPKEVLSLVSWSKYLDDESEELYKVLFCVFILLVSSVDEESSNRLEGRSDKLIIGLDCAEKLGRATLECFYDFVKAINSRISLALVEEDLLYLRLDEYICSQMTNQAPSVFLELQEKLVDDEIAVAEIFEYHIEYHADVFKYTFYNQKVELWKAYYSTYCAEYERYRVEKLCHLFSVKNH
ncbi:hypothetical protein [Gynuella sp.]|uniref:hypothetical protein n=1 Tax=Gynuella sp. TaxID=2969146 RepID=UPI003D12271C